MFKKVLIANRGEIAIRVARACRELGISPVAIYSEPDSRAAHVKACDEAYCVGPAASADSYLRMDKIIEVAKAAGVSAIHPGYGFLSERAAFSRLCAEEGLVFIGPSAEAIEQMGSKLVARKLMIAAGVPVVPGTTEPLSSPEDALSAAEDVGFPVMLKASSGGGGKGMRLVANAEDLASALSSARGEASRSFGDDAVYLEKFVERPRHVEVQIFADTQGNCVSMGERDCSIQRRHQKVIEESPCPVLRPDVRQRMGEIAVRAAKAVGFVGAGTVEFLLDKNQDFYFMEMNTRLQVEHSVTELCFGVDLVHLQILVAMGQPLPFEQGDLQSRGAAVECRIYAEDPFNEFRPSPGPIHYMEEPAGPWTRVDSGVYVGFDVPIHYDPMIAKLAVWGTTRADAIARMKRALDEYQIGPVQTNLPFHRVVMDNAVFQGGDYTTAFIEGESENLDIHHLPDAERRLAIITAAIAHHKQAQKVETQGATEGTSSTNNWRWSGRSRGWS